jgi:adenine-specific DNA methylase
MKSFIETQFPVSKVSKESYKERKGVQSQTLTGLGKWWGRKPLIIVRTAILGLLLPTSNNKQKDREIFLKILTMDEEGIWLRKKSNIPENEIAEHLTSRERENWLSTESTDTKVSFRFGTTREQKNEIQNLVFHRLTYDEKLKYCYRPEEIGGPNPESWKDINSHLGTNASSIQELIKELGEREFGHIPKVGDCFCGGGSVPFEAARIGCDTFASDLNPVATLLTWAGLNIIGGGNEVLIQVNKTQRDIYEAVDNQICKWGIEHNVQGWRADAYLYCEEVKCPECGWQIPLIPSCLIGPTSKTIAKLVPDGHNCRFDIKIESGVSSAEMKNASVNGTVKDSRLKCPNPICIAHETSVLIDSIRGEKLRLWENDDIVPRPNDVFQERLYCIRMIETYEDEKGIIKNRKHYLAPDKHDLMQEEKVLSLVKERFVEWQQNGYIPSLKIEEGDETSRLMRERGWTHWHHLFNPRQLLLNALFLKLSSENEINGIGRAAALLGVGKILDWNSKLCRWGTGAARESIAQTFYNQALNTLYNYAVRGTSLLEGPWFLNNDSKKIYGNTMVSIEDSRNNLINCDYWITDPPYADAINYHELSEFFLAWYNKLLLRIFPSWYVDSKRALAIRGSGEDFRRGMVETYRNLANHMPNNGAQIVMFTHRDASVWADLASILWASDLRVTAAWCIATETDAVGLKVGDYVKGTVLLVLRKQTSDDTAFLDEIYPEVEFEVKEQLEQMLALEDREDPNFADTDYQLAAYAAALRVITKYKNIEDIDIQSELYKERQKGEKNPLEEVINNAVKIACDYLVPNGIQTHIWKQLTPEEKFYIKGLEIESHGEYRSGAYQELARGFGIREYKSMQASGKANETRLKTASEFKNRNLGDEGFGSSMVRHILFAIHETLQNEETSAGKVWLRTELGQQYWNRRHEIIALLRYLANISMSSNMEHWKKEAEAARLLAGAVENDHI